MRRFRVPDSETDTPAHRVSLPAARPPMPAERAWRHRLCSSTFSFSSAVSTCAPPSVRLLDWPDRRASTCDGAPRKCHKSVSSLCRSTTRLAASISAKWQLSSHVRLCRRRPCVRWSAPLCAQRGGVRSVGRVIARSSFPPRKCERPERLPRPFEPSVSARVRAGRRWWPAAPSRPAPPRSSHADLR